MNKLLAICLLIAACGDGIPPSFEENAQPTVSAWCDKMTECGLTESATCYEDNMATQCTDHDCNAEATDLQIDTMPFCLDAIDAAGCHPFITPGVCYTTWGTF